MNIKVSLLISICFLIFIGCAGMQPATESERNIVYTVDVPNSSKDEIYLSVRKWIAQTFRSAKAVIELDDPDSGTLIGNGTVQEPCDACLYSVADVLFTMQIDVKDNKFRISFSNLQRRSSEGSKQIITQYSLEKTKPKLLSFGDDIAAFINKDKKSSDW